MKIILNIKSLIKNSIIRILHLELNKNSIIFFILGTLFFLKIEFLQNIYVGELILAFYLTIYFIKNRNLRIHKTLFSNSYFLILILSLVLFLFGQILSDIINHLGLNDSINGVGRILVLLVNIYTLYLIKLQNKKYFFSLITGVIISLFLVFFINGGYYNLGWKNGLAIPITFFIILLFAQKNLIKITIIGLLLCILNIFFDFRSLSFYLLILSMGVFVRLLYLSYSKKYFKLKILILILLGGAFFTFLYIQNYSLELKKFPEGGNIKERRISSDNWRLAGIMTAKEAIVSAPIFGYGSYIRNQKLFNKWALLISELNNIKDIAGIKSYYLKNSEKLSLVYAIHSQILQAWLEGGILRFIFYLILEFYLIKYLLQTIFSQPRNSFWGLFILLAIMVSGNILITPFAGVHRIYISLAVPSITTQQTKI